MLPCPVVPAHPRVGRATKTLVGAALALALLRAPAAANSIATIVVAGNGDVYFSDYVRDKIWKVTPDGALTVALANRHSSHLFLDARGTLYGEDRPSRGGQPIIWRLASDGQSQEAFRPVRFGRATNYRGTVFTIDPDGNLLFVHDCQIVRLAPDGGLVPITPRPCHETAWRDGRLIYGHLHGSLAWGPDATLYFSDGRTIRRVRGGAVTTLSGRPTSLFSDPQPGEHRFDSLTGLFVDARGNVFAADRASRSILRFGTDGKSSVVARLGLFWSPISLAQSGRDLYVLVNLRFPTPGFLAGVFGNPTLQKLSPDGRLETISSVKSSVR
jgi:hypothetical protein